MLRCADLCAGLDQVDAELAKLEDEDNVMHQDMVQQAIDDVSMKYQAVVHTHVNGLEQEGLAVMRIPEQSCPPLPSPVRGPPPSPPTAWLLQRTAVTAGGCAAQAPGTFAAEDEEAIDAEIAALHKQLAERTAEHQHLRQQLAEEEQQGCAALLPLPGTRLADRQLLFRRARCAEKLPQLQSAVGAAAPAVSGRLVQEVSALGERCSNIAQETKSQLDKVTHTCQPGSQP